LRDPAQFEPWLYRLAANAAIDYLRRNRRTRVRLSDLSDEQLFTIEKTQALTASALSEREREGRDQATRLLDLLNGPARSLLILKEVEGLSLRELAAVFGISEDAVKVRLFRARQRILKEMSRSEAPQREGVTSAPFSAPLTVTT
jgi:RNA polymerase sigma-70 factor (ECF subfamily)